MKTMTDRPTDLMQDAVDAGRRRRLRLGAAASVGMLVLALVVLALTTPGHQPPSSAPVTTPSVVSVPPAVGVDFDSVVRNLEASDHFLRLHPDPELVAAIYDPANPVYADAVAFQRQLVSGDRRYDPLPEAWQITSVRLLSHSGDTARVVVAFAGSPRYRVLDRDGRVVSDKPAGPARSAVWTLRLREGLAWRILGAETL